MAHGSLYTHGNRGANTHAPAGSCMLAPGPAPSVADTIYSRPFPRQSNASLTLCAASELAEGALLRMSRPTITALAMSAGTLLATTCASCCLLQVAAVSAELRHSCRA